MVGQVFEPMRLKKWLEREKRQYLKKNPTAKKFKLHNLRGTAMSKAKEAGIHFEDAAIAFGCNADTMRKHYLALDELAVTDRVMDALQGNGNGAGHKPAAPSEEAKSGDPRFSVGEKNGASGSHEERRKRGEI
jgi:hypothetical protein